MAEAIVMAEAIGSAEAVDGTTCCVDGPARARSQRHAEETADALNHVVHDSDARFKGGDVDEVRQNAAMA